MKDILNLKKFLEENFQFFNSINNIKDNKRKFNEFP